MTTEHNKRPERIMQDPEILVGKPVIKGTRIPVELVLAKLAANPDLTELFQDYPRLTVDDVKACLTYAQFNRVRGELAQMVTSYNGKLFGEVSYVSTRRATRPSLHRCRAGVA